MKKRYYFFKLEIALNRENDTKIYAFHNVSHIPTSSLIQIFEIDLAQDPYLLEGYFLTKANYEKHKQLINDQIGQIDLEIFEYCLRLYESDDFESVRKLYKEDVME